MSRRVFSCPRSASLRDAAIVMHEHDCGYVPIVDARDHVIGVVTDRDICLAAAERDKPASQIHVEDFMTSGPELIRSSESVASAERAMQTARIRRLPVVDSEDRLVGVVSLGDIARSGRKRQWNGGDGLSAMDVGNTLAAVSTPTRQLPTRA